ncbi:MAG: hypothetical protein RR960_06530 [Alistipes sp.]
MTTQVSEIDAYINSEIDRLHRLIIGNFCSLGEKCIIEARDRTQEASWFDHTGNLRSSIGYVVVCNGQIVNLSGFDQVLQGSEGSTTGRGLAERLARSYKTGYALIVVAGMNYAAYVEAMENKCVLVSAELFAAREAPLMMQKLKTQMAR